MSEKRVAIVTGGTRGMGFGISKVLAQKGYNVIAVGVKSGGEAILVEMTKYSPESCVLQIDISDPAGREEIVNFAVEKFGRIDVLVNNAGIYNYAVLEDMEESVFDRLMDVNFKSMVFLTKAVLPVMKKSEFGRIINASSIAALYNLSDVGIISSRSPKAPIAMFTNVLAAELGPYNITVNAYAPGTIKTDMAEHAITTRGDTLIKRIPMGRFGELEDVGYLVAFLASEEASYITGEHIGVDGGMERVQNPQVALEKMR